MPIPSFVVELGRFEGLTMDDFAIVGLSIDIAAKTNHLIYIGIFGSVGSLTPFPALCLEIPMSSKAFRFTT
jgi:hypothetical protein